MRGTSGLLPRKVQIPQRAPWARQNMYTIVAVPQSWLCLLSQPLPLPFPPVHHATVAFLNPGHALHCVGYADVAKPCTINEPFVLTRDCRWQLSG